MRPEPDAAQRLSTLALAHRIGAMVTLLTGVGLWLIARRLHAGVVSGEIPDGQVQFASIVSLLCGVGAFLCLIHGAIMLTLARWIKNRTRFRVIYTLAGLNSIIFPTGTVLFFWVIQVLGRPDVIQEFKDELLARSR